MAKVVWSLQAVEQLDAICAYIALDSAFYAEAFEKRVLEKTRLLVQNPKAGNIITDLPIKNVRQLLLGKYRILYRYGADTDEVQIIGIIHGARLINPET